MKTKNESFRQMSSEGGCTLARPIDDVMRRSYTRSQGSPPPTAKRCGRCAGEQMELSSIMRLPPWLRTYASTAGPPCGCLLSSWRTVQHSVGDVRALPWSVGRLRNLTYSVDDLRRLPWSALVACCLCKTSAPEPTRDCASNDSHPPEKSVVYLLLSASSCVIKTQWSACCAVSASCFGKPRSIDILLRAPADILTPRKAVDTFPHSLSAMLNTAGVPHAQIRLGPSQKGVQEPEKTLSVHLCRPQPRI